MTEQEKFLTAAAVVMGKDLRLLNARSSKYTGDGNAFQNVETAAALADITGAQGIMNRFGDKLGRIREYMAQIHKDGDEVDHYADEKFEDSIADARNYLLMLLLWVKTDGGNDFAAFPSVVQKSFRDAVPTSELDGPKDEETEEGETSRAARTVNWFRKYLKPEN
tara:strand:+ start:1433 stop:1927 length:495 start_codon:yes stop_codon:yes gene_type:complete